MGNRKLTISKSSLGQFIMYAVIIGFTIIAYPKTEFTHIMARTIQAFQVMLLFYLLLPYARNRQIQVPKYDLLVHLWWLFWLAITMFRRSEVWPTTVFMWMNATIFLLIVQKYWRSEPQQSFKILAIVLSIYVYLNAFLLILHPEGLWEDTAWIGTGDATRYLFGNYNAMGIVCLCALMVQSIYTFLSNKGYVNLCVLSIVSLFTVMFVGSATSTIGLIIVVLYMLFHKYIKHPFVFVGTFFGIYILFVVLFVFMGNTIEDYPVILQFVENVLGKNATFSQRTTIWQATVDLIMQHPWVGNGYQSIEWNVSHIGASGPHNLWLEFMMYGGIISIIGFILLIAMNMYSVYHNTSYASTATGVCLCVLLLMSLFETYSLILIFMILQITYNTSHYTDTNAISSC